MRPKKPRLPGHNFYEDRRALPWFTPEGYEVLRDIVLDPKLMPFSYDQWKETAELKHRDLHRQGLSPVRVVVDPDEFVAWCAGSGYQPSGDTLSRYCYLRISGVRQQVPRGNIKG